MRVIGDAGSQFTAQSMSPIGRYCCRSRKSSYFENLAKVDFLTPLSLQSSVAPIRRHAERP
jgi:hypothetical protein